MTVHVICKLKYYIKLNARTVHYRQPSKDKLSMLQEVGHLMSLHVTYKPQNTIKH